MIKKYRPIREKITVLVDKMEEVKSAGGIILDVAEREIDARQEGIILDIGPKCFFDTDGAGELKVGDKVLFSRYAGKTCSRLNGSEVRVMRDIDIMCVIEEEE